MSRRRPLAVVVVALAGALLPAARAPALPASPNAAFRWDKALLDAIKETRPGPTIAARALAVLHTCMYDAWAAYDTVAVGTGLRGSLRQAAEERTPEHKEEAVSRAARLAAADLFPQLATRFDAVLAEQGFDPTHPPAEGSPAGVAQRACGAVLDFRHHDGANQLGDEPGSTGAPYSDWTGYRPVNDPDHVSDPDRWQPLRDGKGGTTVQPFLTPHWGRVVPFAPPEPEELRSPTGPPRAGTPARSAETDEMLRISAGLTDEEKVIAEYWADGAGTELPPGHWMLFGQFCSRRDTHGLDDDVKFFFVLANAMLDASVSAWDDKRRFDSVRPITLVRHTYAGQRVFAWGGPYQGTVEMDGSQWRPYIATPPFPEYVSGHSTFSAAGAAVLRALTGRGDFGASMRVPAGSSRIEPGAVPAHDVVLHWTTFDEAADQAGLSRRLGGIHFLTGDLGGRLAGRWVATRVLGRAREYFTGTAADPAAGPPLGAAPVSHSGQ